MLQQFTGEQIHTLPSIHDYQIGNIQIEEDKVIFSFEEIDRYDSTDYYCKGAKRLEVIINVADWDFSEVEYAKRPHRYLRRIKKPVYKQVALSTFLSTIDLTKERIDVYTIFTTYNYIKISCTSYYYDLLAFDFYISDITYHWITE